MSGGFIVKFLRFCVVGGSGVIVDFATTYVLKEWAHLNKYIANSVGFLCAASSNYVLNRVWTFQSTDPHVTRQYLLFIGISAIGLVINNGVIWLLNDRLRIPFHRLLPEKLRTAEPGFGEKADFYISKLAAVVVVTVWNFLMNYFYNFH